MCPEPDDHKLNYGLDALKSERLKFLQLKKDYKK
jgi:hypothetical protein